MRYSHPQVLEACDGGVTRRFSANDASILEHMSLFYMPGLIDHTQAIDFCPSPSTLGT